MLRKDTDGWIRNSRSDLYRPICIRELRGNQARRKKPLCRSDEASLASIDCTAFDLENSYRCPVTGPRRRMGELSVYRIVEVVEPGTPGAR